MRKYCKKHLFYKSICETKFNFYCISLNWVVIEISFYSLLQDFLNQFSAAQTAILEASAAAAEAAKANMQQVYKDAFRIRLNIQLKVTFISSF